MADLNSTVVRGNLSVTDNISTGGNLTVGGLIYGNGSNITNIAFSNLPTGTGSSQISVGNHSHGNILTGGTITSTAVTAASGVVVVDSSNKIQKVTSMSDFRTIIGAGTSSLTIGTTATTAAKGDHTHTITLASGGTSTINLVANTAYTLTAGGSSVVFKTPSDISTAYPAREYASGLKISTGYTYNGTTADDCTLYVPTATGGRRGVVYFAGGTVTGKSRGQAWWVSYGTTFGTTPKVSATYYSTSANISEYVHIASILTTGFYCRLYQPSGASSNTACGICWVAVA